MTLSNPNCKVGLGTMTAALTGTLEAFQPSLPVPIALDLVVDPHDGKGYYYFERVHSELICADLQGFRDDNQNDGPFTDEKFTSQTDVDIVWKLDMIEELGVFPHNLANCSPVADAGLLFCSTGNGQDEKDQDSRADLRLGQAAHGR